MRHLIEPTNINMNIIKITISIFLFISILVGCGQTKIDKTSQVVTIIHTDFSSLDTSKNCKCEIQFELKDSLKLTYLKSKFYRSKSGHLYERTFALREINGLLTECEYFNGHISQDIDPYTFKVLDGWFAKDKNNVYYYRAVSGGMQISKLDSADTKTFKLLNGHYKYAVDVNHFYDETEIIQGFSPNKTKLKLGNKEQVLEMTSENKKFEFELN